MAVDYEEIRTDNIKRYGTDIARIGKMLLAERYGDRAHFIYELIQNAEDAFSRRGHWRASRSVDFELTKEALTVSHYGKPFDENDVRGICGIGEGTKDKSLTTIGCFGIGFKAVYEFTNSPEIYSGDECFAIDDYVCPRQVVALEIDDNRTLFRLPLLPNDSKAHNDIAVGLRGLGVLTLLFLNEVEELNWKVEGGEDGAYIRAPSESISDCGRKVVIGGQDSGSDETQDYSWLIFSRKVFDPDGSFAGNVEIAFQWGHGETDQPECIIPVKNSQLVVFFPTIVATNLGFLVQGPYRTTPSRDNVPRHDDWNRHLVEETALLLRNALLELRDIGHLDAHSLQTLPLNKVQFGDDNMFTPLFEAVRRAFQEEKLLPTFEGTYVVAKQAKLARSQELRKLFDPSQLADLCEEKVGLYWLSSDITLDRSPLLKKYLMKILGVQELEPLGIAQRLNEAFLTKQTDEWLARLYEFLSKQPAALSFIKQNHIPILRLEDGSHVAPFGEDKNLPQAYLPGVAKTDFPTVRQSTCRSSGALLALQNLGLKEPDVVDDIIYNVLPKFSDGKTRISNDDYKNHIERILGAFSTDSKDHRDKLIRALSDSSFIACKNMGDGSLHFAKPGSVYVASARLKALFRGVPNVLITDDSHACLRGEKAREMQEASGISRTLHPFHVKTEFSEDQLQEMRKHTEYPRSTGRDDITDISIRGLDALLNALQNMAPDDARQRANELWKALIDMEDRRGKKVFQGIYCWFHYAPRKITFDARLISTLRETAWIPDASGTLQRPDGINFESIDPRWEPDPFLLSKIEFKRPALDELAKEAGIAPGVLSFLKQRGLTNEEDLKAALHLDSDEPTEDEAGSDEPEQRNPDDRVPIETTAINGVKGGAGQISGSSKKGGGGTSAPSNKTGTDKREFISYVATSANHEEPDPDGLHHERRMALEEKSIKFILSKEPGLKRTQKNNRGFDLFEENSQGNMQRFVEVKAMTSDLTTRPVSLSKAQFEWAQIHRENFWLYIVEHADDPEMAEIIRVKDPAGKARSFSFDQGWRTVAETSGDDNTD